MSSVEESANIMMAVSGFFKERGHLISCVF